jgi:hypothetical protein
VISQSQNIRYMNVDLQLKDVDIVQALGSSLTNV